VLPSAICAEIEAVAYQYWRVQVAAGIPLLANCDKSGFGQRAAVEVEEQTRECLRRHFPCDQELREDGTAANRSIGDVWLSYDGLAHPVNVKTGGPNASSPNVVSLNKLARALAERRIDSYGLLVVRFLAPSAPPLTAFVDLLDWLDLCRYDAGPGQLMLSAAAFARLAEGERRRQSSARDIGAVLDRLLALARDGDERLFHNRRQRTASLGRAVMRFPGEHTPLDQSALQLGLHR